MLTVPGSNVTSLSPHPQQGQPLSPTLLLMAAATVHQQGRLFEPPKAPDASPSR